MKPLLLLGAALLAVVGVCEARADLVADELLDLAFRSASAMPVDPHIKDRSRAQEAAVAVCLELGQPDRALTFVEGIDNWRRGVGYADVAFFHAQQGDTASAQECVDSARQVADGVERQEGDDFQAWRRDRILARIAKVHLWLGQTDEAARLRADLAASEAGELEVLEAALSEVDDFEARLAALDQVAALGDFERMQNALEISTQLFDRVYQDEERRSRLEGRIQASWAALPIEIRIDVILEMAGISLDHGDVPKALALLGEAQAIVDGATWLPEHRIPLAARVAGLRHRAGETERARSELDAAMASFDAERAGIVDISRAATLRPLAEACQAMGDTGMALAFYKRAVEEGVHNPNSRPRAEDLSATCLSLALHGVEPDDALWARLREVHAGLGDPW